MSDTLIIHGNTYLNVPGIKATDNNNIVKTFICPTGTVNITENGTVDVTQYASANVSISGGGTNLTPRDETDVTVSGATITIPAGAYSSQV
ncbi:MAG: hypothetical protein LIR50_06870 [Bacillota bacterium]|nr:hypothetical protein [Bacillota bacterium]